MNHFGRKATLGAVAFAMVGSTLFGGAALAHGKRTHGKDGKQTSPTTPTPVGPAAAVALPWLTATRPRSAWSTSRTWPSASD